MTEIKMYIAGALILAILAGFGYCGVRISSLKAEISSKEVRIAQLEIDVENAVAANKSNIVTIDKLRNDNKISEDLIAELQKKKAADKKKLDNLLVVISNSKDTTPPADVLRDTVEYIIKGRL